MTIIENNWKWFISVVIFGLVSHYYIEDMDFFIIFTLAMIMSKVAEMQKQDFN